MQSDTGEWISSAMAFQRNDVQQEDELKYIKSMDGDIWYVKDNHLWQLSVSPNDVTITDLSAEDCIEVCPDETLAYLRNTVGNMFYTIVSNYSLYAYNSRDFLCETMADDNDSDPGFKKSKGVTYAESESWISRLFHKNDGYQIPIVITPLRKEGNIDINLENELAVERLISLLIRNEGFRTFNNHLTASGIVCSYSPARDYGVQAIKEKLELDNLEPSALLELKTLICKGWSKKINEDLTSEKFSQMPHYDLAIDYLVYKTLKIAATYSNHKTDLESLIGDLHSPIGVKNVEKMLNSQLKDYTHITRKIYQTLAYIIYPIYRIGSGNGNNSHKILTFDQIKEAHENIDDFKNARIWKEPSELTALYEQSLIPPPFLDSFISIHETGLTDTEIDFDTLSSGEKQQIYTVSSLLYHLDNLNSVGNDNSVDQRIAYRNEMIKKPLKTFSANIHEMLRDSFFLSKGTQGCFAQWEIGRLPRHLELLRTKGIGDKKDLNHYKQLLQERIDTIDEPFVRSILQNEHDETFRKNEEELIRQQMEELQRRLNELEAKS